MDAGKLFGRGVKFPPQIVDGRMAWSAGEANIRESIQVVLLTDQGERLMLPAFGGDLGQFLFEPNTVATRHLIAGRISRALAEWEPRIRVESVAVELDPDDDEAAVATITFRMVATEARERVSLNITLGR